MTPEARLSLVRESSLAPSVHNIQPGRWHFDDSGRLYLCADTRVTLPAADPSGHDRAVSLGALLEGMSIALAANNLHLQPLANSDNPIRAPYEMIAAFQIQDGAGKDPLREFVFGRQSHRGVFTKNVSGDKVRESLDGDRAALVVLDRKQINEIARLHGEATLHFLSRADYQGELYHWLRFNESHPRFHLDGLNARAMGLDAVEAWVASYALRPRVYAVLNKIGLAGALVAESAQTTSASGLVLFRAPRAQAPLEVGRSFYRVWLKITRAGFSACPMSSSIDFDKTRAQLEKMAGLAPGERLVNILRFGRVPEKKKFKYEPSRLKPDAILI